MFQRYPVFQNVSRFLLRACGLCRFSLIGRILAGLGFAFALLLGGQAAFAKTAGIQATEMPGFGRIILNFETETPAKMRVVNSVLIVEFAEPVKLNLDKIAEQLPNYVSIARLDPDGRSMRFGMTNRFNADMKPAGERIFIDILSTRWQGLPPPLPNDVVQDLARRARVAEEQLRKIASERERAAPRVLELNLGSTPTLKRATFTMQGHSGQGNPELARVEQTEKDGRITLTFDGKYIFEADKARAALAGLMEEIAVDKGGAALRLSFRPAKGLKVRGFKEDDSYSLDFTRQDGSAIDPFALAPSSAPAQQASLQQGMKPEKLLPLMTDMPAPSAPESAKMPDAKPDVPNTAQAQPATGFTPKAIAMAGDAPISLSFEKGSVPEAFAIRLNNLRDSPIAVLQRREAVIILIETGDKPVAPVISPELASALEAVDVRHIRHASVIRLVPKTKGRIWLVQQGEDILIRQENTIVPPDFFVGAQIPLKREFDTTGREILDAQVGDAGLLHWIDDPASGQRMAVVPISRGAKSSQKGQVFVEFSVEPTLAGFALLPLDEAVTLQRRADVLRIGHEIRLTFSPAEASRTVEQVLRKPLLIDLEAWSTDIKGIPRETERKLMRNAAESPKDQRSAARLRLARFYMAQGFFPEANVVLDVLAADDHAEGMGKAVVFHKALVNALMGRTVDAQRLLNEPTLAIEPEQVLIQAVVDAKALRPIQAVQNFKRAADVLTRYPERLQAEFRRLAIEAGIAAEDAGFSREQLLAYEELDAELRPAHIQQLMAAKLAELQGRPADAYTAYVQAASTNDPQVEAEARFGRTVTGLAEGKITPDEARTEFETLSVIWRRGEVEVKSLAKLGEIYVAEGRWRDAFLAAQRATAILPDHPLTRTMEDAMARRFENLFLDQAEDKLSKVEALALYQEFRSLVPPGRRGDEIARRLADRLHDLDLVAEAAEILEHQVNHRLEGVAKSTVAARLGLLYLQNHQPLQTLATLRQSRLANVPPDLRRARAMLEARALSEVQRTDLAIEILANETGDDIERLRADIHWKGKNWREAGEGYERLLGDSWQGNESLSPEQRLDALRAGLAYVLGGERLSNNRLRGKFLPKMTKSEDAGAFNLLTQDNLSNPQAFREAARAIISADTMSAFLASYRKRFPETSGVARPTRRAGEQATAPTPPARG